MRHPPQVWLRAIGVELGEGGGGSPAAQKVLDRALAALPARKHVKAVTQAALAEFRGGSVERARSIMEGVLRNYPRRLDLWSVYLDQVPRSIPPPRPHPSHHIHSTLIKSQYYECTVTRKSGHPQLGLPPRPTPHGARGLGKGPSSVSSPTRRSAAAPATAPLLTCVA